MLLGLLPPWCGRWIEGEKKKKGEMKNKGQVGGGGRAGARVKGSGAPQLGARRVRRAMSPSYAVAHGLGRLWEALGGPQEALWSLAIRAPRSHMVFSLNSLEPRFSSCP